MVQRKDSLGEISNKVIFVVCYMLKKININWVLWIREYMVECFYDTNSTASLPYGLLVCRIIADYLVDISVYMPTLIDATYNIGTFSKIDYVFINEKWYKKEFVQSRADTPWANRIFTDPASLHLEENEHIKVRIN